MTVFEEMKIAVKILTTQDGDNCTHIRYIRDKPLTDNSAKEK